MLAPANRKRQTCQASRINSQLQKCFVLLQSGRKPSHMIEGDEITINASDITQNAPDLELKIRRKAFEGELHRRKGLSKYRR